MRFRINNNLARDLRARESAEDANGVETGAPPLAFKETRAASRQLIYPLLLTLFLACLYGLLVLPLFQLTFEPFPRRALRGLSVPKFPSFTSASFLDGSFQKRAEDWFLKGHGFWGYLVPVSNELTYRLFNQVSANYGTTVLVGRDRQLFQPMYLRSFNKVDVPPVSKVEKRVKDLKELQDLLAQRGIAFTLLISTNVLLLYPELIPSAYTDPSREGRKNSYDIMVPLLRRYGVNYIDTHQLLSDLKPSYPFRLFQTTGSHWNDVAACRVTGKLVDRLSTLMGKQLLSLSCEPVQMESRPRAPDRDLLDITNFMFPGHTFRPAPYVKPPEPVESDGIYKPKFLLVGTSFSFSLLSQLKRQHVSDDSRLFFYYRHVRESSGRTTMLNRRKIDWEGDILSHDAVIIETNAAGGGRAGLGFLPDALKHLRASPKISYNRTFMKFSD